MLFRVSNREDPDVCAVFLCLFDKQLVFEILEHLPKYATCLEQMMFRMLTPDMKSVCKLEIQYIGE